MVLTGIVVSVSSTAVALALACRVQETANVHDLLNKREGGGKR
jgi:multisubunit Na+/H+ antiporter MnhC subunit